MGCVDLIPGISGSTLALVMGIYQRLVMAISHFNQKALMMLYRCQWRALYTYLDLFLLLPLILGIMVSIAIFAEIIHYLLLNYLPFIMAIFFALVLNTAWLLRREINWHWRCFFMCTLSIIFCLSLSVTHWFTLMLTPITSFFIGALAICVMFLPGISGSLLLLLLGVYEPMLEAIAQRNWPIILAFIGGGLTSMISISRFIIYALSKYYDLTVAAITGLLLGSTYALWPWRAAGKINGDKLVPFWHSEMSVWQDVTIMAVIVFILLLSSRLKRLSF